MDRLSMRAPRLVQRECGGWLALSSRDSALQIGVTGESEEDARTKYETTWIAWIAMLEGAAVGAVAAPSSSAGLSQAA